MGDGSLIAPPNKLLQRSGVEKVLGRGRGEAVLEQVRRARVLKCLWPVAERGCWATLRRPSREVRQKTGVMSQ